MEHLAAFPNIGDNDADMIKFHPIDLSLRLFAGLAFPFGRSGRGECICNLLPLRTAGNDKSAISR
jgi:hypothetical protein